MSKAKTNNMYILTWNIVYNNNPVTQNDVQLYFQRPGPRDLPYCSPDMHIPRHGYGARGSGYPKRQWSKWDTESIAQVDAQEYQGSEIDVASINSDNIVLYDIDADMILDYDIVGTESVNNDMDVLDELSDINQLRAELNVLGGSDCPPPNFVMSTNYSPATLRYSPVASPAYSPSMSPLTINIDSDSEHGNTPPQNGGPIVTRGTEIFDLPNDDSDTELDREVELINMMGSYINRNRIPYR